MPLVLALLTLAALLVPLTASAQTGETWITAWAGSAHGPYPVGNPSAQPDLRFAFPDAQVGARDQTFRLIVPPDIWGRQARLRFSNAFGTRPVTIDGAHVGLQLGGPALIPGTNAAASFGGHPGVTIAPGDVVWSDPIVITDGKVDGNTITFKVSFNGMTINHTGTFVASADGDTIKLTTKSDSADFPASEMTLKRAK